MCIEQLPDVVKHTLNKMLEIENELERLKVKEKRAKGILSEYKSEMYGYLLRLGNMRRNDRLQLANYLYWNTTCLTDAMICRPLLNYPGTHLHEFIIPLHIGRKCEECGKTYIYPITDKKYKNWDPQWPETLAYHNNCPQCEEINEKEWERKREREQNLREKRREEESNQEEDRLAELKTMPYSDYLATSEWNKRRKRAYWKAGYKCQLCGAKGNGLNAHHNSREAYKRRGEEWDSDLTVLCNACNANFHNGGKRLGVH